MTLSDYLRDRIMAYMIWAVCYVLAIIFLLAFKVDLQPILAQTLIYACAVTLYELWNYNRKKKFYNRLRNMTEELDKKYLLPEMLSEPDFYEGKLIFNTLYQCDKSMTENVNRYRQQAADFREYIELWVHEVKIPVSALGLISHNNPGPVSEKINAQLMRIDDCINNVLYYARSENAEKDYIIKEVSLKKALSNVAVRNREALRMLGASLKTDGLDRVVMTDSKWLEFIIGQLMANSIKYASPNRELEIFVYAIASRSNTTLYFRDNGVGISRQDLPYVFEKSFTGHNGRKDSDSTGMGLYIVKNLCERLGHGIGISSAPNEYTEVHITFGVNDYYQM